MKPFHACLAAAIALSLGGCYGLYGNDEGQRYTQRWDSITLSAGDAKEVNARTHMIHPWPYGVGDRRIPAEGTRMVGAVDRYNKGPQAAQGRGGGGLVNITNNTNGGNNSNSRSGGQSSGGAP